MQAAEQSPPHQPPLSASHGLNSWILALVVAVGQRGSPITNLTKVQWVLAAREAGVVL